MATRWVSWEWNSTPGSRRLAQVLAVGNSPRQYANDCYPPLCGDRVGPILTPGMNTGNRLHEQWAEGETPERRTHTRFKLDLEMSYSVLDGGRRGETGASRTIDLSSSGLRFEALQHLPVGLRLQIAIDWPVRLDGRVALQLIATGSVVRSSGTEAAVKLEWHTFKTGSVGRKLIPIRMNSAMQ
jgi:hypothetical protein